MRLSVFTSVCDKEKKRFECIRLCMLLSGLSVFSQLYLFQPLLGDLSNSFRVSAVDSSLAVSLTTIGMAFGLFLWAFKADVLSRKQLMSFSLILSSALTLASAFVSVFPLFLLVNFLKGVLLSGVSAVALAYLSEEVNPSVIGAAISLYLSGNTLGGMGGRIVGTLLTGWSGWHVAVWVIGIVCLTLGVLFVRILPASRNFKPSAFSVYDRLTQMGRFLKNPQLMGIYMIAALSMGVFVSVYNYISLLLESPAYALSHQRLAGIFLIYIAGVVGSMLVGRLSDRYSPYTLLRYSLLLLLSGLLMLLIPSLEWVIGGLGVLTFAFFSTHTMASRIVTMQGSEALSSATSLYWLFYYAGSGLLGSATGIWFVDYGWNSFVGGLILLVLVSFVALYIAVPGHRFNFIKSMNY